MKCPKADCGFEVEGSSKFCPECGAKMETKPKLEVVICKNILEDGSVCNAEIKITHKFCNGCGKKVDKQMFEKSVELCQKCKAELVPGCLFCSECGERVTQKVVEEMMEAEPAQNENTNKPKPAASKEMSGNGQGNKTEPAASKETSGNGQGNKAEPAESKEMSGNGQGNKAEPAASKEISGNGQGINKDPAAEATTICTAVLHDKDSELRTQTKSVEEEAADRSRIMRDNKEMICESVLAQSNNPVSLKHATDSQTLAESFYTNACRELSKDTGYENHLPPQPYTTDLDADHEDGSDSEYEEGDTSSDEFENLAQHAINLSVESSGNRKKRKRKTIKTANKIKREKKRERKREKHEQKKGNIGSTDVISSRVGSLTIRQEDTVKEDRIKQHEIMEPGSKGDCSRVPSDVSSNGKHVQTMHDPSQLCESAGNIKKGEKVFGTCSDVNENAVNTGFEVKGPPSCSSLFDLDPKKTKGGKNDKKGTSGEITNKDTPCNESAINTGLEVKRTPVSTSLFDLDPKETNNANNDKDKSEESPNKNTAFKENAVEEYSKKIGGDHGSGMQTRSMTKDMENNQKKNSRDGKGEGKGQRKQENPKPGGASRPATERTVCVHFVALISQDFKLNISTDKVYIRGQLDRELGWNNRMHEMKFTRRQWNGNFEVEYKCNIPYSHLSKGGGLEYKYWIVKHKGNDKKELWDGYLKCGNTGEGVNRILNLPEKIKSVPDIFQKFDGIVNRQPESQGLIGRFIDHFMKSGKLKKDCEQFIDFFCSHYMKFDSPSSVKENMDKVLLLFYQLRKMYVLDGKCWSDDTDFKREIGSAIMKRMIGYLVTAKQAEDRRTSFIIALSLLSVLKGVPLTDIHFNDDQQRILCKAFLVEANGNSKACFETEFIDTHYPNQKGVIKEGLLQILRSVVSGNTKDPSWLFLTPLVHFLNGDCKPFEFPTSAKGHEAVKPIWWGIGSFDRVVTHFQQSDRVWAVPLKDVLDILQPLFKVDYFLSRTFMAALNLTEVMEVIKTGTVPIEVCCATLNSFVKSSVPHWYQYPIQATLDEQLVCKSIEALLGSIQSDFQQAKSSQETLFHLHLSCQIAEDMYVNALRINRTISESLCMQLLLYCVDSFHAARKNVFASLEKDKETIKSLKTIQETDTTAIIQKMLIETQDWLRRGYCFWCRYTVPCLNIWNCMVLQDKFLQKETVEMWNSALGLALEKQLDTHLSNGSPEKFIQVYCHNVDSYKDCVQEVMSKAVIKAVEGGYKFDFGGFHEKERKRLGHLLSDMFVNYWEKAMKTSPGSRDEVILKLVLAWPPFTSFLQVLSKYQEDIKRDLLLSPACTEKLVMAISVVEGKCRELNSGLITVTKLRELQKFEDKFAPVVDLIKNADFSGELVSKLIKLRCKEISEVEHKAALLSTLTSICHSLPGVDLSKQDAVLAKVANIGCHCVKDFCQPLDARSVENIKDCHQNLTAFCLSAEVDQILEPLQKANTSTTFVKLWQQECSLQKDNCKTLEQVVEKIWNPVHKRWITLSKDIASGDIEFTDIERYLGITYKDLYDAMRNELLMMELNEKTVAMRIKQVQQYRQLETSVKGAKVILKFAELYHLSGNFQQIRDIALHENIQMKMKSFDDSLMDTCKVLKDITLKQSQCLVALIKADPLIKWLKESMKKDGLKELKVFVDLALISAGEQPLDIDRVQGLNTAVLGYSPLIFDLKPDADYKELLAKCKLVWKELDTNPKLPDKLVDSNRHLEWLKTIQKAHGSVEVSSLAQAEAINSNGVFSCGYVRKVQEDAVLLPTKVLKLCVRGQDANEARNYTYDQLQDLQSRLMLVAGRANKEKSHGKDEVETFTEVFDGMKRLSTVFIKLHDAGCVLFKTWQASFFCDPNRPVCAILEFGQGVDKIKGRRTEEEDTGFIIHRLAKFLEACLDEWLKYISEKRNSYLHLNYFTIDQLVQLQREMVKIGTEEEPSVMIYPLLSAIKQDCTPVDLNEALNKAEQQLNQIDMEMSDNSCDEEEEQLEDEMKQTFIEEMIKAGFAKHIAVKALDVIKPDQIDEGIVWCMQHDSDSDDAMETGTIHEGENTNATDDSRTVRLSAKLPHSDSTVLSIASSYMRGLAGDQREFGVGPLIKSLEELWKTFIGSISSNLKDHLSLEHLGLILQNLSHRCTIKIDRPLLAGYKPGVPNLVIVPTGDVINTLLTIYMMADNQPLPQSDEVLLCNSETKLDEVDIFWRRAIFDGGNKIHCLVNADLLDFDVSDRAEKLLEGYIQQTSHEATAYRLVVICGSDNEYRSRIVSALDKYRRPASTVNACNVASYLLEKFRVTKAQQNLVPAALVDFENCSVRVIKSWRSGVGKTLYQQRRERQLEQITRGQEHYSVTVPLQDQRINFDAFIKILLQHTKEPQASVARIFHLDISHEVQDGVDFLLFNLLILRCLTDKTGHVWRRSDLDLYLIENLPLMKTTGPRSGNLQYLHSILGILPSMTCHSPRESLEVLSGETIEGYKVEDQLFDLDMFQSPVFQRPFQYLLRLDTGRQLQDVNAHQVEGTEKDCLKVLLRHCGIRDPSWSELHHFVWFLNTQLHDYEGNNFVSVAAAEDLPGFAKFVLRFLIQMSRDFATRSLNMSEESPLLTMEQDSDVQEREGDENEELQRFQMRRTWESR